MPSPRNSASNVQQPDSPGLTSEEGIVKQEEGFELSDMLAKELHDLFLMYVDPRSNDCMGVSNFISFVCDAGLEKHCNVEEVKILFDGSSGSLTFSSFLQSLGTLATSCFPNENNFSTAMHQLIVNYLNPLMKNGAPESVKRGAGQSIMSHQGSVASSKNTPVVSRSPQPRPEGALSAPSSPTDQGKPISKTLLPVLDLHVKLTPVKGGEGEFDITYFFGNNESSDFVINRKFVEPLRQVFAFYSLACNSAMRVPLFGEIQRNQVQDRMNFDGFQGLLADTCCLDAVKEGEPIAPDGHKALTLNVVEHIFRMLQLDFIAKEGHKRIKSSSKDPFGKVNGWQRKGRANWKSSQRYTSRLSDSIRKALGKVEDDHGQSIKEGNNSVIDFRTFLLGLAHVAVWRTTNAKKGERDGLLPLVIENFIKHSILVYAFRREPTIPRLRPSAIFKYLDFNIAEHPFINGIMKKKGLRFGFQGLYLHYSTHWNYNRHRYTEAKSRSGVLTSAASDEVRKVKHWENVFRQIDGNRDGYLNLNQVCLALKRLEQPLIFFQVEDWMVRVGKPRGDELGVSLETFLAGFGNNFDLDNELVKLDESYDHASSLLDCGKDEDAIDGLRISVQPECDKYSIRSRFSGMSIQRAIDFAKDFEICPALLSEAECRGIYSEVATRQVVLSITSSQYSQYEETDHTDLLWQMPRRETSISLDCEHFVAFVFSLAHRALGKYPFNSEQSTFSEKVLLLLWRIEHSKKGKMALALKSTTKTIFGPLPSTVPIGTRHLRTNPSPMSFVKDLGVRPGVWETLNKQLNKTTERALWASMAATKRRKSNVASPRAAGATGNSTFLVPEKKQKNKGNKKKSENLRMKREAAERRSRGNAWSGYSLETVDFKKKAIGSGPVDESIYHKRGAYMGRHWRKNKARQRPQDNRARFVKSLTSHGLRSSGTRKEARNATVRHHGPSFNSENSPAKEENEGTTSLRSQVPNPPPSPPALHDSPSASAAYDAQSTPLPPKTNNMNSASVDSTMKAWDAELASELKKLRAELSDAVGDN